MGEYYMECDENQTTDNVVAKVNVSSTLFSFDGVIGRRDYFLNSVYIGIISTFFTLPYTFWAMRNANTTLDYIFAQNLFIKAPLFLQLWLVIGSAYAFILTISNIIRRLDDVNGEKVTPLYIFCGLIALLCAFGLILPAPISVPAAFAALIMQLCLIFIPGKETSKLPYDYTKIFNWGAFFGTWIWGLFNKSYKTLWCILLFFTPWGFYYQLICGLKGNKWAFKNKKWDDVTAFNKSQEKQATIFSILAIVIIPVLYFTLIVMAVILFGIFLAQDIKTDNGARVAQKLEQTVTTFSSVYFESHEITKDANKFYVNPIEWANSDFSDKKSMLDLAASLSAMEREKADKSSKHSYTKSTELPRTKIYSSKNKELLGEFNIDEKAIENSQNQFTAAFKAALNAYRFYKPTLE